MLLIEKVLKFLNLIYFYVRQAGLRCERLVERCLPHRILQVSFWAFSLKQLQKFHAVSVKLATVATSDRRKPHLQ